MTARCAGESARSSRAQGGVWVQTNEVYYVYDGNLVIQERDINNLPTTTYTRGKDLSGSLEGAGGIGGLLARTSQAYADAPLAGQSYYHSDGNGNVTMLIDSFQGIVAKYLYDAFGNIISKSGLLADANLYRFSSKEAHPNSGLVYYLYRYYDPNLQRWPNRDPLTESGFETVRRGPVAKSVIVEVIQGPDLYEFVRNNPINLFDLLGNGAGNAGHPTDWKCECEKSGGKYETVADAYFGGDMGKCVRNQMASFPGLVGGIIVGVGGGVAGGAAGAFAAAEATCHTVVCYKPGNSLPW